MFSRPLFVGAHVDDVELFAGGTLARFADKAKVLVFSHHEGQQYISPNGEFRTAMEVLGVGESRSLHFGACIGEFEARREEIALELRAARVAGPSIVITHQSSDTNQDHQLIYREVLRVFKQSTSIICGSFPANDLPQASRTLFVSLTEENIEKKIAALDCYKSQHIPEHRKYFRYDHIRVQSQYCGALAGTRFAEAFEVIFLKV